MNKPRGTNRPPPSREISDIKILSRGATLLLIGVSVGVLVLSGVTLAAIVGASQYAANLLFLELPVGFVILAAYVLLKEGDQEPVAHIRYANDDDINCDRGTDNET